MHRLINNPTHWRQRADEARAQAAHMETEQGYRMMRRIANGYDLLAIRAEERISQSDSPAAIGRGVTIKLRAP